MPARNSNRIFPCAACCCACVGRTLFGETAVITNNETWHWDIKGEYDRDMPRLLSSTGEEICNFGNCTTYYPTEGSPPMPHHMALIAAAPKMLQALKLALEEMREDWLCIDNDHGPRYKEFDNLDAAIADKDDSTECIRIVMEAIAEATGADNGN